MLKFISDSRLIIQSAAGTGIPITVHLDHVKPFHGDHPKTQKWVEPIICESMAQGVERLEMVTTSAESSAPLDRGLSNVVVV